MTGRRRVRPPIMPLTRERTTRKGEREGDWGGIVIIKCLNIVHKRYKRMYKDVYRCFSK